MGRRVLVVRAIVAAFLALSASGCIFGIGPPQVESEFSVLACEGESAWERSGGAFFTWETDTYEALLSFSWPGEADEIEGGRFAKKAGPLMLKVRFYNKSGEEIELAPLEGDKTRVFISGSYPPRYPASMCPGSDGDCLFSFTMDGIRLKEDTIFTFAEGGFALRKTDGSREAVSLPPLCVRFDFQRHVYPFYGV